MTTLAKLKQMEQDCKNLIQMHHKQAESAQHSWITAWERLQEIRRLLMHEKLRKEKKK